MINNVSVIFNTLINVIKRLFLSSNKLNKHLPFQAMAWKSIWISMMKIQKVLDTVRKVSDGVRMVSDGVG